MIPNGNSLLGRISQAAMVILLVAVACGFGWRLIKPLVPAAVMVVVFGLLFRYVIRHR